MELVRLHTRLEEVNGRIATLERLFVEHPKETSLRIQLNGLYRRRRELTSRWVEMEKNLGRNVCTYCILPETYDRPSLTAVTEMLSAFQRSFTAVYDGIVRGARQHARINKVIRDQTTFQIGHTEPGSLIVTLVIQENQLSFWREDNTFTRTCDVMFGMSRASQHADIDDYVHDIGALAVRRVYDWAKSHVDHQSQLRMSWEDELADYTKDYSMQLPEFSKVASLVETNVKEDSKTSIVSGRLIAWDLKKRTFRMESAGRPLRSIFGKISPAFDTEHSVRVPEFYKAHIAEVSRGNVVLDRSTVHFVLNQLEQVP